MNRRTFMMSAGGAAAAASFLSASGPTSGVSPIKHIVHVMMENRSFDHLLGWFPNADGKQAGLSYVDPAGVAQPTYPLAPDWVGCGHNDPDHSYSGARIEYNNGAMDGFLQDTANDTYAIGYYVEQDVPILAALSRHFTTCDRYFPSMLGPTFPNRIFAHAGQSDRLDDSFSICSLPTIWDNLKSAGVSHKYYYGNLPVLALWGLKYLGICSQFSNFISDCANGTLPSVSYVDPSLTLILNFENDDHPHSDIRNGEAFLSQVYQAVSTSPNWDSTVVVINRDEWGGFFEHIAPPRALAPNNIDPDLVDGKALLGCRVPATIISPWTRGNPVNPTVNSTVFDHTSVLKLIESVFNVQPLAARETSNDVGNILDIIDARKAPQPAPKLPTANPVFPQKVCLSGISPGGGSSGTTGQRGTSYQGMVDAGMLKGWPVKL